MPVKYCNEQGSIGDFSILCFSINLGREFRRKDGAAIIRCECQLPHDRMCGLSLLNLSLELTFFEAEIIFGSNE